MLLALVSAQTYQLLTNLVAPKKPGEHMVRTSERKANGTSQAKAYQDS